MKILLFSDSHGYMQHMTRMINKHKDIDMVIHLGDMVRDAMKLKELYPGIRVEIVRGNNDWMQEYPPEKLLELDGKKILITHGHVYNVKYDYHRIVYKGKATGADAVFFGHTHQAEEFFSDGMLVLNPGSIGASAQTSNPTCSLVEIREDRIISRFLGFN